MFVAFGLFLVAWNAISDEFLVVLPHRNMNGSTSSKSTLLRSEHTGEPSIQSEPKRNLQDFHRCIDPIISLPFRKGKGETISTVYYQCQGTAYDDFANHMEDYIEEHSQSQPSWGRRSFPFPDNTKILIVGNSHTRQTYQSLLCQYQAQIDQADMFDAWSSSFHFQNNVTLVTVANTPYVYSKQWRENLESIIGMSLSSFDVVVMGIFNKYDPASKTTFLTQMLNYSQYIPNVDFEHVPAPSISKMARAYKSGPLIALGMFSPVRDAVLAKHVARVVEETQQRSEKDDPSPLLLFVSGRTHVNAIGYEGGSTNRLQVDECDNTGKELHRCAGQRGGHADLLAWDIIETIHQRISSFQS
jgi:hypothetical protein